MGDATEVVLAGSSAGGVGVVNHAQWVRKQLLPNTELLVIFESAWFINFQGRVFFCIEYTASNNGLHSNM